MANLKLFNLFLFFALIFSACSPVEYKFSKNYTDKLTISQPFLIFDFRSTDFVNQNLKLGLKEVCIQRKFKFDTLSMTPLTYFTDKDVNEKIKNHNADYVFFVSPLDHNQEHDRYGVHVSSINYLVEIRKSNDSSVLKKCVLTIPLYHAPPDEVQVKQIKNGLNQFLDY